MKYNYDDMSNISDIIGKQLHYSESFKSALGEPVTTAPEALDVESMSEPGNTNGGIIHWVSFGGGRGIYMEEPQIIDVLNKKEVNITLEGKIATLALIDTPSSVTYEAEETAPAAGRGRGMGVRTSSLSSGWRAENENAERMWENWSNEQRDKFLVKYLNALDVAGKYYELIPLSWHQLSDNVKELVKIESRGDDVADEEPEADSPAKSDGVDDVPAAESGVIVGRSDINGRPGEKAIIGGKVWKVGGGEIIMSEKASRDNCKELSRMNVLAGGVPFDCDEQKEANIDRASGAMPKDEYHKEAAGGRGAKMDYKATWSPSHKYSITVFESGGDKTHLSWLDKDGVELFKKKYPKEVITVGESKDGKYIQEAAGGTRTFDSNEVFSSKKEWMWMLTDMHAMVVGEGENMKMLPNQISYSTEGEFIVARHAGDIVGKWNTSLEEGYAYEVPMPEAARGAKHEMEHAKTIRKIKNTPSMTTEQAAALIAADHTREDARYYEKLEKMENPEAGGRTAAGGRGVNVLKAQFLTLDELFGEEEPDGMPGSTLDRTIGAIGRTIKEYEITEEEFNEIAKEFRGLDLVYSNFAPRPEPAPARRRSASTAPTRGKDKYIVEWRPVSEDGDDYSEESREFDNREEAMRFARSRRDIHDVFYYPAGTTSNPQRIWASGGRAAAGSGGSMAPGSAYSSENLPQKGEKVKTIYGNTETVLRATPYIVTTYESAKRNDWFHPAKVFKVSSAASGHRSLRYEPIQTEEHNIAIVLPSGKELKWLSQAGVNEFKRKYPDIKFTTKN